MSPREWTALNRSNSDLIKVKQDRQEKQFQYNYIYNNIINIIIIHLYYKNNAGLEIMTPVFQHHPLDTVGYFAN